MSSEPLPPAQPIFILRGHSAEVHALHFTQNNRRLLTGDADGWVVLWDLALKRPEATWKGHDKAILGLGSWGQDRVITCVLPKLIHLSFQAGFRKADVLTHVRHGRDNKLVVWQLGAEDEQVLNKTLPVDANATPSKQPWVLHVLTVNTLNFCSFAMCLDGITQFDAKEIAIKSKITHAPILITVPNTADSGGVMPRLVG